MLTKNPKTHIIIFKDWSQLNITKAQYDFYREEVGLKKHNEFIKIDDIDTKEILFEWRCSEIKEFKERKQDRSMQEKRFVCDFWWRHPLSQMWECDCDKEYKCMWFQFRDRLKEMWYTIDYASDITSEMQIAYKKKYL